MSSTQAHAGKRILLIANSAWNLANFRRSLMQALRADGYRVIPAAPHDGSEQALSRAGFRCRDLPMDRQGVNPLGELIVLLRLFLLIKNSRSDAVLSFTIKPNLYGGIACRLLGIPFLPNVTGLGTLFITRSPLTALVTRLFALAYKRARRVFFQNDDDRHLFLSLRLIRPSAAVRVPGSGIDLARFQPASRADAQGVGFLFIGRFLADKGIMEFYEAARLVKARRPEARFMLLGGIDPGNPRSLDQETVDRWQASGLVECLGRTDDVRPYIAAADCVVLPSYREGMSRTLLEAAAMGKPVITTDVPGCREAVEDGRTGFLCRPRDAHDLAEKMERLLELSDAQRISFGQRGREKAEREFDEAHVIRAYLRALHACLGIRESGKETAS